MTFNHCLLASLLVLTLMTGIVVCLRQSNFSLINEVKALVSIIFGFATSCLLLSFVWLIQRKPLHSVWSEQEAVFSEGLEAPSMHPRGRSGSDDSFEARFLNDNNNIRTVSSMLEQPPKYDEALINSKPILNYLYPRKETNLAQPSCCDTSSNRYLLQKNYNTNEMQVTSSTSNSIAQLALNIVKNFSSHEPSVVSTTSQQVVRSQSAPQCGDENNSASLNTQQPRKISYCQLDVSQLMLSESPPKYCELSLSNEQYTSNLSRNSDEPRADEHS